MKRNQFNTGQESRSQKSYLLRGFLPGDPNHHLRKQTTLLKSDSYLYKKKIQIRICNFHLFKETTQVISNPEERWERALQPDLEQNHLFTVRCFQQRENTRRNLKTELNSQKGTRNSCSVALAARTDSAMNRLTLHLFSLLKNHCFTHLYLAAPPDCPF